MAGVKRLTIRRAVVDIHQRHYADGADWTTVKVTGYDVTDILIRALGDDDGVLGFVTEPWEMTAEIRVLLCQDPDLAFDNAEIDPDFDLLDLMGAGLDRDSEDVDILLAWERWKTSILSGSDPHAWARRKWAGRTARLEEEMKDDASPADVLLPFARILVSSPAMLEAVREALHDWSGDPIEGMRAIGRLKE